MNLSIRRRIQLSFLMLVTLFAVSASITIVTLNSNNRLSNRLSEVVDPSLQALDDFKKLMLVSKMYTTNWVFLRSKQEDKELLQKLHRSDYNELKNRLAGCAKNWTDKKSTLELQELFTGFENLLAIEKEIMTSLKKFEDYDDPVTRLEAERKVEEDVLHRTARLMERLDRIISKGLAIREQENKALETSSFRLQVFIFVLLATSIVIAVFLSLYLTQIIVMPLNQIRWLMNDLGKGITKRIRYRNTRDEIGKMISSINHLSENLERTAAFAHEVGMRNFNVPFDPLSDEDTLGKALLSMRDKLKDADERLNEAQHIAGLGSWEWDLKTNEVFWTDELYRIFEIDRSTSAPSTLEEFMRFVHPEDGQQVQQAITGCFEHHQPYSLEHRIVTSKNHVRVLFAQGRVTVDASGTVVKMYGTAQDITARKEGEREIKEFNERFQRLSNATNDAIWDWNLVTDHVWWNENFYRLLGYDAANGVPGLYDWTTRIHPEDRDKVISRLKQVRKQKVDSWEDEFRYQLGPDNWGTVLDRAYVIKDENGKPVRVIGALQNITERKKSERRIADKNVELEQKNKELEQFAYVASHDLQEPIRTISSFVDVFQKQYRGRLDSNADKFLTYIVQASDRMKTLIQDLLDYSRIGKKKELVLVDCNTILSEVLADLGSAIEESGAIVSSCKLPVIYGYSTEIKQLFQNLIINAIKFRKKDTRPEISICVRKTKGYWEFAVKDNGIGIDPQYNERIFVIFQRLHTRSEYEGSGIGLSHCKKIVELHDGKIWVDSTPGQGSTFFFTIQDNLAYELA